MMACAILPPPHWAIESNTDRRRADCGSCGLHNLAGGCHVVNVEEGTQGLPGMWLILSTYPPKLTRTYAQSSRPPSHTAGSAETATGKKSPDEKAEDSAAFLANDLALQRLIAESHILSAAGGNASHYLSTAAAASATNMRPFAEGRTRLKTTDMRIQALGAKESVLAQVKMPMSMRKGIIKSAETKEDKRRREARENGIVLERVSKGKGRPQKKRSERPVDMPSIGKMRGAELRISAREVRAIEAEGKRGGREKGGRRRRQ